MKKCIQDPWKKFAVKLGWYASTALVDVYGRRHTATMYNAPAECINLNLDVDTTLKRDTIVNRKP